MLQYLINTTAIWLLSLLAFDIFVKRESYHGYNRVYLLSSFLLGILLPSWQANNSSDVLPATRPVLEQVTVMQETIVTTAQTSSFYISMEQWIGIIYMGGVIISMLLLAREAMLIYKFFSAGKKSKDGVWTIVETGRNHSPFSAFRYIFISSKENYDHGQLRTILLHEEQHGHLLHFIDLLLMQLAKVIFWFHPLVYLYHHRLMTVHEYQADAAVEKKPEEYGRFLIEQSMLSAAPALSHSFNRSPIKKRIMMLTHRSSAFGRSKKLIIAPLMLACMLFFTQKSFSEDKRKAGNKIYYKGNEFELWAPKNEPDTVMVQDPVTGELRMVIARIDSFPRRMNGEYIHAEEEMTADEMEQVRKTKREIQEYIESQMKPELTKLEDGVYFWHLFQVVIDDKGKIVYYEQPGMRMDDFPDRGFDYIIERLVTVIDRAPRFTPVNRGGKPVNYLHRAVLNQDMFEVKNHKINF